MMGFWSNLKGKISGFFDKRAAERAARQTANLPSSTTSGRSVGEHIGSFIGDLWNGATTAPQGDLLTPDVYRGEPGRYHYDDNGNQVWEAKVSGSGSTYSPSWQPTLDLNRPAYDLRPLNNGGLSPNYYMPPQSSEKDYTGLIILAVIVLLMMFMSRQK